MSGWLVARNRPPFGAYASPGPSGKSDVAGASVRFDLTDVTSKDGSADGCAISAEDSSPVKTTFDMWRRIEPLSVHLTPGPANCSARDDWRRICTFGSTLRDARQHQRLFHAFDGELDRVTDV